MDVTFVLEESGVTATVEVPCEADVAAAKEVACTALAVSPASVEMRIGTQVLEGTCRLQDTAFGEGVQVVLACPRFADIKCPAEYTSQGAYSFSLLSRCGMLCVFLQWNGEYVGFDTETFDTVFSFRVDAALRLLPSLSQCKTRCYLACVDHFCEVALPGGEVLRKFEEDSREVFACGGVVVSKGTNGVSVYDKHLTLLRSLSHEDCNRVAVSDCGGWVMTSSNKENNVRLWDVTTGAVVACVPAGTYVALSRSASVFAVECSEKVQLYDWSGAALGSLENKQSLVSAVQFTPCGKYVAVSFVARGVRANKAALHQYDVATMSCVRVFRNVGKSFTISPCSRVVVFRSSERDAFVTRHLYPY